MTSNLPKLYNRKDSPYWWYHITIAGKRVPTGTNIPKTVPKDKALKLLMEALNIEITDKKYTAGWLYDFIKSRLELANSREKTIDNYNTAFRHFINYFGIDKSIEEISRSNVFDFQNYLLKEKLKASSINNYCSSINTAIDRAINEEILEKNPFRNYIKLKENNKSKVPLSMTPEQINKLLIIAKNDNYDKYLILLLLVYIGYRRTEVMSIPRSGIDFEKRTFLISNSKKRIRELYKLKMSNQIIHDALKHFCGKYPNSEKPCYFCIPSSISRWFKKIIKKAGLPDNLHLHNIRHSFVTNAINQGYSGDDLKEYLHHSSLAITEIYTHRDIESIEINLNVPKLVQKCCKYQ